MSYSIILFTNLFSGIFFLITWTLKVFDNFYKFHKFSKLLNFGNLIIFQIKKKFFNFKISFWEVESKFVNKKLNNSSFFILIYVIF